MASRCPPPPSPTGLGRWPEPTGQHTAHPPGPADHRVHPTDRPSLTAQSAPSGAPYRPTAEHPRTAQPLNTRVLPRMPSRTPRHPPMLHTETLMTAPTAFPGPTGSARPSRPRHVPIAVIGTAALAPGAADTDRK